MSRVAVAVSGGADSLYALISLQEAGHEVMAIHGLFLADTHTQTASLPEGIDALKQLCHERHIPLHICDFRQEFDAKVIMPFVQAYATGTTPNPCALCNKQVKFGLLMDKALELGAALFATGHYASLDPQAHEGLSPLGKGQDAGKDQSYFLSLVPRERFKKVLFPLANTQKADNKAYLQSKNIAIPIAKESQEICFVPADAYRQFLLHMSKERKLSLGKSGPIYVREQGQEILLPHKFGSKHAGLWNYTEGQRRGLGVAWKEPLYVCAKDSARNALILGNKEEATLLGCEATQVNYLLAPKLWPEHVYVRVRYRQQEALATVQATSKSLHITFAEVQSPTAPGQIAAVYDHEGRILAGGIIWRVF